MRALRALRLTSLAVALILAGTLIVSNGSLSQIAGQELFVPGDCDNIQACIDKASPGATIIIDKGNYPGTLTISKELTLQGRGPDLVTITSSDPKRPTLSIAGDQAIRVTLTGIAIQGSPGGCPADPATCHPAALIQGDVQVALRQVELTGSGTDGLALRGRVQVSLEQSLLDKNSGWGIVVTDQAGLTGRQLFITRNGGGVSAEALTHVILQGTQIGQNAGMGVLSRDAAQLSLEENQIVDNAACGAFALAQGQISGLHNMMKGNGADLCGGAPASLREPLTLQTVRQEIAFPGDYATLQEAVDALIPGGTITLAAGNYQGGLTLWKPLTLRGAEMTRVTLTAHNPQAPVVSIVSEGQGVRLEGITLIGGLWGTLVGGQGEILLDHVQLSGNGDGLSARDAAQVVIDNSQIAKNTFNGISLLDASRLSLHNSIIQENDHWGIALVEPPCFDAQEPYSGEISGAANQVQSNGQKLSVAERDLGDKMGNFCPQALKFLGTLTGGSY
jgi:hypothetical protein